MKKANLVKELKEQNMLIKCFLEFNEDKAHDIWKKWSTMIACLRNCDCINDDEYSELWIALNKDIYGRVHY